MSLRPTSARPRTAALAIALGVLGGTLAWGAAAAERPAAAPTVVELFTSQGCSSCPPADALLRDLAKRPDVIALSMHVNYWNYIGWVDPFATDAATDRQHAYSNALQGKYVYTPQMVIDGVAQEVGSRREKVMRLIERTAKRQGPPVPVEVDLVDGRARVAVGAGEIDGTATVWLVEIDQSHVTDVASGENRGRTLKNVNVVRAIRAVGEWSGQPMEVTVDLVDGADPKQDGCAVLVQKGETGPILGAAMLPEPGTR